MSPGINITPRRGGTAVMNTNLSVAKLINPKEPQVWPMLGQLQGNILRSHGRAHAIYLLLSFEADPSAVRTALQPVLRKYVRSAAEQHDQITAFKRTKVDGGLFGSFFISASGYRKLGFTDAQIRTGLPETAAAPGTASAFFDGMKAHSTELGDPPVEQWEEPYRSDIDALLLLADNDRGRLDTEAALVRTTFDRAITVAAIERGGALRSKGRGVEHFGFADGISQPIFFEDQLTAQTPASQFNQVEPLSLVLVPDNAASAPNAFGSYFVFRKLEQNVRGFRRREMALARALDLPPDSDLVGAMVIGRTRDGTPLGRPSDATNASLDDFRFGPTSECPMHAHIRKANPRGDIAAENSMSETLERRHRIVRRGMPYGAPVPHADAGSIEELPERGVGMLFGCYQASIANQFAFMQSRWLNRTDFAGADTGVDPLVTGESPAGAMNRWTNPWDPNVSLRAPFGTFVTMKGGEYFFAPSLPFLERLAPPE